MVTGRTELRSAGAGVVVYVAFLIILAATAAAAVERWWLSLALFAVATVLGLIARSEFRPWSLFRPRHKLARGRWFSTCSLAAPVGEEGTGAAPPVRRTH